MSENTYHFDIPKHQRSIIKVIGVGGGGSNAVNHMFNLGIKDVEFVVCNTDVQALNSGPVPNKLQIGINLTGGLGAGANPEKGRNAALESKEEIREILEDNTKMVFVTAGMGGGTGTGAAPIIAKIAKDLDILTVGIVTAPFIFEGKRKMVQAKSGIQELKECCDTVLVISNEKLREIYGNLPIREAFGQADNVLTTAAKGIAEIITVPGYVNVDFQDVRTVMYGAGAAVMGSATTEGENRAIRAAEEAISSPLLNNRDIHGAQKILLSIISGEKAELQMDELSEITEYIQEMTGDEAEVIFGHGIDPELEDSIRVTVIATGFDQDPAKMQDQDDDKKIYDLESSRQISLFHSKKSLQDEELSKSSEPDNSDSDEIEDEVQEPSETDEFKRGYFFDNPETDDEEAKNEEEIETEDDGFETNEEEFQIVRSEDKDEVINEDGMLELKKKKEYLQTRAKERMEKLKGLSRSDLDTGEFKEKLDVPAYLRKNVSLEKTPHSSEINISRYNLNDDNQILGNNKFLHDNVD